MNDDIKWKLFNLKDLFSIEKGTRLTIANRLDGNIPFVTAGHENQGISSFIGNDDLKVFKNSITIDMFAEAFYRDYSFCCDDNIHVLTPNTEIDKYASLFIVTVINSGNSVWSYGKQYRLKTFERHKIMLPITDNQKPNYEYMSYVMKNIEKQQINKYKTYLKNLTLGGGENRLNAVKWKEFYLNELFEDIQRGKRLTRNKFIDGDTPYISSSSLNNGIDSFVGNNEGVRIFENCLTLANSGSVGSTFYHPYSFVASDHVTHLKNPNFNKYVYLFIATMAKRLSEKYNFNREINDKRLKKETIILPVDAEEKPDYEYMEQYMINLEINLLKKYLKFVSTDLLINTSIINIYF